MASKLNRLIHRIAIQLHLVAESCTICISRFRQPVRKLLDTPPCIWRLLVDSSLCTNGFSTELVYIAFNAKKIVNEELEMVSNYVLVACYKILS
jgi:hypothetical protein